MTLDAWPLERLVCPATRTPLRLEGDRLVSDAAGLAYPIEDGVPVLLVERAEPLPSRLREGPGVGVSAGPGAVGQAHP